MTFVMMLGGLIALYASEYMSHDVGRGYGRFFAAFCLFVFSMSCLVMGDNLFLLYLGWEGVGLCSYLLIGYFYKKPEAVAAAKKAFIVNRIGDLGLALGVFLIYTTFGTVEYTALFQLVEAGVDGSGDALAGRWETWGIPCLLMIGAFGKSAQLPLYVWLPDAMEGPTPVSALIHAATMVTAGIYLIARMFPLFTLDPNLTALNVVAWVGALTALLAATIGMAQFDIKRIMAYSTVSQLGYMFAGLGVLSSTGAVYHVFTHAFFKAMLFLACGAVMHGFAGQLDLRKLSGLWSQKGWKITTIAMFVGCLNLAGVPFMAGYWSKDIILAESFTRPGMQAIGWILLFTAGLTAYYTFRVFFRVFVGPAHHEPGDEVHDHEHDEAGHHAGGEESLHDTAQHGDHHADHFHPHPPQFAMNLVLGTLTVLTLLASTTYFLPSLVKPGSTDTGVFIKDFVVASSADQKVVHKAYYDTHGAHTGDEHHGEGETHSLLHDGGTELALIPAVDAFDQATDLSRAAAAEAGGRFAAYPKEKAHHASLFGFDPHKVMYYVSGVVGLIGILIAAFLHGPKGIAGLMIGGRTTAAEARSDAVAAKLGPIPKWAEHKWYVDEFYDLVIVGPLRLLSYVFQTIDKLLVDGLVNLAGILPRGIAHALRPAQNGILHTYATGMAFGIALVLVAVWLVVLANGGS
ncbi:MAG: NADH-quinone oxidoreductase subunit L [Planctomycetota bacterium]